MRLLSLPSEDLRRAVACMPSSTRERSRHAYCTELNAPEPETDARAADAGSEHGRESDEPSLQSRTVSFANFEARRLSVQHAARALHNAIDGAAVNSETGTTFNEQSGLSDISGGVSPVLKAAPATQDSPAAFFCTDTNTDWAAQAAISEAACTASPAGTARDAMSPDQGELAGWPCAEDTSAAQFWSAATDDMGSSVAHPEQQRSGNAQEVCALPGAGSEAAGALTAQEVQGVNPGAPAGLGDLSTAVSGGELRCENTQPNGAAKRRGAARMQKGLRLLPKGTAGRACHVRRVHSWRKRQGPPAEVSRRQAEHEAEMLAAILALQMAVSEHTAAFTALRERAREEHHNSGKDPLAHTPTAVAEHAATIKALREWPSEVARDYCTEAALYPWATTAQSVLLDGPWSKQGGPLPLATLEPLRCQHGSTAGAVLAAVVGDSIHSKPEVLLRAQPALPGLEAEPAEASFLAGTQSCDARSGKSEASQLRAAGVADEPAAAAPPSPSHSRDHHRSGCAEASQSRSAEARQRGLAASKTLQQKLQKPRAQFSRGPTQEPLLFSRLVQGWQRERKLQTDALSSGKLT